MSWPDGTKYVGEFADGVITGKGTKTWPTGEKYVGDWSDDKRQGHGIFLGARGTKYDGEWHKIKNTEAELTSARSIPTTGNGMKASVMAKAHVRFLTVQRT